MSRDTLTVRDVAELAGVHPDTVRRWAIRGHLRAFRRTPTSPWRFLREDVRSFLEAAETPYVEVAA